MPQFLSMLAKINSQFMFLIGASLNKVIVNPKYIFAFLLLVWLAVQWAMFVRLGVRTPVDSEFYLSEANQLLSGEWVQGRGVWYVSYSAFLALVFWLGGSNEAVVLIQILLSGLASWFLYSLALSLSDNRYTAFLTIFFFLGWIKIHEWNTILYTESLFTSCSIICFACLQSSRKPWQFVGVALLLVFTFFIRPTGFAFLAGVLIYSLVAIKAKVSPTLFAILMVTVLAVTFMLVSATLKGTDLIEGYRRAEVIYPNISLGLDSPKYLVIPNKSLPPLARLSLFAFQNPIYFTKLCLFKLILFFGNVKPYFSTSHNAIIVCVLYPIYVFAIIGFFRLGSARKKEKYFIASYILSLAAIVSLTSENWDGRFLVPILPFVFLMAAVGMMHTFKLPSQY